jgi:hypothetical protein
MNSNTVLQAMAAYVEENMAEIEIATLADTKVVDVLVSSFEVLDFTMELEEKLDLTEETFDITELSPKLASMTFAKLADDLANLLNQRELTPLQQ